MKPRPRTPSWIEITAGTAFGIGIAFLYLAAKGWIVI